MKQIVLATFILFALAGLTYGHGMGQSLEKQIGDHTIDIGYDAFTPEIPAGENVRFDFNLWNSDKTEPVDFTTVWVRIAPESGFGFLFAGTLGVPEFGPTGMSYVFPNGGSYELTARFQHQDKTLAEGSFLLVVAGFAEKNAKAQSMRNLFIGGLTGLLTGIAAAIFFRKRA